MNSNEFLNLKKTAHQFRFETSSDRIQKIKKLQNWIKTHEQQIYEALKKDFNKPDYETLLTEIYPVLNEAHYFSKNLKKWMKNKKVKTPLALLGHTSHIRYENKGVVLIIAPWNYPFQLAIAPLIAALGAGNTVVIKPSELTPHTSNLIAEMIASCFQKNEVMVELGGKEVVTGLLNFSFDHVFFTGSTQVGKIIAQSCAEKLIPTTLELGGKSPVILDATADHQDACERIFWGKFLNRGQTCIAPDYLIAEEPIYEKTVQVFQNLTNQHTTDPKSSVINKNHVDRLKKLADSSADFQWVQNATTDSASMKEEIFGPVLPILKFKDFSDLEKIINHYEKPLSFYIFSKNNSFVEKILKTFPSGGAAVNSVMLHFANHHLPFGGVGHSGMGKYHGHFGFLELSHQRAVLTQSYFSFLRKVLQPPYTDFKVKFFSLIKKLST